jgi:outer membrane protein assembly factor BamB
MTAGRGHFRIGPRRSLLQAGIALAVAALCCVTTPAVAQSTPRAIGDTRVFATLPYPGHPGGLAVDGQTLYVDTSAADYDRPFDEQDEIYAYDLLTGRPTGSRPNPIDVFRTAPVQNMGLAGLVQDASRRLYAADMNGRVVRIDPRTGAQQTYATIPTSTYTAFTSMPVFMAFGRDGSLFVGDSDAPVIWRVPPGGGRAQAWFVDPRIAGSEGASVLGVAIDPSGRYLYFAAGNQEPQHTAIYRLPLDHPDAADLEVFHDYPDLVLSPVKPPATWQKTPQLFACVITQGLGAGAIAFGRSGKLYVALLAKNQVSILEPDGTETMRFPDAQRNALSDVPFVNPFDVAFNGRGSLLMSNIGEGTLAYPPGRIPPPGGLPVSKTWVVFDIFVNDTASPLNHPSIP